MLIWLHRLKTRIFFSMGADKLNNEFMKFMQMHLVYLLATSITTTFVNTLLMRVSTDQNIALKYNIFVFALTGIAMATAAFATKRINNKVIIIIGISLAMSVYLLAFFFMPILDRVYIIVAVVHGIASGFYWLTYFSSLMIYTNDDTRDIAMSLIGVFGGVVTLVMPMISGYAIELLGNLNGYYVVFGICFLVAIFGVNLALHLPVIQPTGGKTKFGYILKKIYTTKVWFFVIHMDFFKGIREGAFSFFLNVLLFKIVSSEGLVGTNTFLVGIVSMFASLVAGKVLRPKNRMKAMFIGTTILTFLSATLFLQLSTITVLALSLANAFLGVFVVNPTFATLYTVLDIYPKANEKRSEVLAITECYKNAGRITGVLLIIFLPQTNFFYVLSLVLLTASQYITTLFAKITLTAVKEFADAE